jgi:hypothetical protein
MLTTTEEKPAARLLYVWALAVLHQAGAIRQCEEHGWMQNREAAPVRDCS